MPTLAKTWQILLKGLSEVQSAPNPQSAAEMILIRLTYAADLPDPAQLFKRLEEQGDSPAPQPPTGGGGGVAAGTSSDMTPQTVQVPVGGPKGRGGEMAALKVVPHEEPASLPVVRTLEDVVAVLEVQNEILLASQVHQFAHLVKLEVLENGGRLEIRPESEAPPNFTQNLGQALSRIYDARWVVSVSSAAGAPTLAEVQQAELDAERAEVMQLPIIKEILDVFPDAEIRAITPLENKDETDD